jgi:hypothetical protein
METANTQMEVANKQQAEASQLELQIQKQLLVTQAAQQEDAHHQHHALLSQLRQDLDKEKEAKMELIHSILQQQQNNLDVEENEISILSTSKASPGCSSKVKTSSTPSTQPLVPSSFTPLSQSSAPTSEQPLAPSIDQPTVSTHISNWPPVSQMDWPDLPFVHRKLPEFAGKPGEDFEAWEMSCKNFIEQFTKRSESDRVKYIAMGLQGNALRILKMSNKQATTTDEFFSILRDTFGTQRTISEAMSDIKQIKNETVRVYFGRVKALLLQAFDYERLGNSNPVGTKCFDNNLIDYFTAGLNLEYQEDLFKMHPRGVDMTLDAACQVETDYNKIKIRKTNKPDRQEVLFGMEQIQQLANIVNSEYSTSSKLHHNKEHTVNHVNSSIFRNHNNKQLINRPPAQSSIQNETSSRGKFSGYHGVSNSYPRRERQPYHHSSTYAEQDKRPNRIVCFHCKKQGHSFRNCLNATQEQKNEIAADFFQHQAKQIKQTNILNFQRSPASSSAALPKLE